MNGQRVYSVPGRGANSKAGSSAWGLKRLTPWPHELNGSLNESGSHYEVPIGVDEHTMPCSFVQTPEPASTCDRILHTHYQRSCLLLGTTGLLRSTVRM